MCSSRRRRRDGRLPRPLAGGGAGPSGGGSAAADASQALPLPERWEADRTQDGAAPLPAWEVDLTQDSD
jgi:hypothetical protein